MALVDIVRVRTRVLEELVASPNYARYTDAVSGEGDYAVKDEITHTIQAIDLELCGEIIDDAEGGDGVRFLFPSANLASGDFIPDHEGARGPIELNDGVNWQKGHLASSMDEMNEVLEHPTLYAGVGLFYFLKLRQILHNAAAARAWLPLLSKLATCQAHERYENAEVFGTIMALERDGSNSAFFRKFETLYMAEKARRRALRRGTVVTEEIPDARERAE